MPFPQQASRLCHLYLLLCTNPHRDPKFQTVTRLAASSGLCFFSLLVFSHWFPAAPVWVPECRLTNLLLSGGFVNRALNRVRDRRKYRWKWPSSRLSLSRRWCFGPYWFFLWESGEPRNANSFVQLYKVENTTSCIVNPCPQCWGETNADSVAAICPVSKFAWGAKCSHWPAEFQGEQKQQSWQIFAGFAFVVNVP